MKELERARRRYDEIPVPAELNGRIEQAAAAAKKQLESRTVVSEFRGKRAGSVSGRRIRRGLWAAAAAMAVFVAALNTSTAFAQEVGKIPVIGAVARVFTFRSYEGQQDGIGISVEIPGVEMIAENTPGLADFVNEEIHALCQQYADEAIARAEEYRTAFLETGGTEEEWEAHDIRIQVRYSIKSQTEDYLSFLVTGTENWTSAYSETRYYNIDLKRERIVTLEDVLGGDYRELADASIREQIQERAQAGEVFWTEEEGGFSEITDETKFYMNEAGNPVVVFDKYEIAPGSSGEIEFEIKGGR